MFIDRVRIKVVAGAGGNGCTSFRREKYVPLGGPNGGDGGHGGDINIVAASRLGTLQDLRYHSTWQGNRGVHGKGSDMHGKCADAIDIPVPIGTIVRDFHTGEILADLVEDEEIYLAAHGGKGGKGNARFVSATNKAPRFNEAGEPGEVQEFLLELKLLADVGIVGLPNAGKSTFLSHVTEANPKIGDYPFTTISPNLGVVSLSEHRSFTVADIPGIIEGAAQGKGLGHDFLRHIERTKVLLFFIDPSDVDPVETLALLEKELSEHSEKFNSKPRVVAFTKGDVTENRESYDRLKEYFDHPFLISSATGAGLNELQEHLWETLEHYNRIQEGLEPEPEPDVEFTYESPFTIHETDNGFVVEGKKVVRAVRMTHFENDEAVVHLGHKLKKMGLYKALHRLGAQEGQSIFIGDVEMEYRE
jgi:GTP-binding protein